MKRLLLALGLMGAFSLQAATVNVAQTLYRADGVTTRNGSVTISWTTFVSSDGHRNAAGSFTIRVTAGAFSVNVEPNDTSIPLTQYKVVYHLDGSPVPESIEYWTCPTSGSPVLISACATTPAPPGVLPLTWIVSGNDIYNANSRSVLVGGSTNGNYKFDVQKSGSSGTMRVYDLTAITGTTLLDIYAGAGQGTSSMQRWLSLTAGKYGLVNANGGYETWYSSKRKGIFDSNANLSSDGFLNWNATDDLAAYSIDTALARNAAGILEVNSGAAGAYRDVKLRLLYTTSGTEPTCNSGNRGVVVLTVGGGGVADKFRICSKDDLDNFSYRALY